MIKIKRKKAHIISMGTLKVFDEIQYPFMIILRKQTGRKLSQPDKEHIRKPTANILNERLNAFPLSSGKR